MGRGASLVCVNSMSVTSEEIRWAVNLLVRGKVVGCASERGVVLLGRADSEPVLEKLSALGGRGVSPWVLAARDVNSAWSYWDNANKDSSLNGLLEVLWPGPLVVANKASSALSAAVRANTSKAYVWIPGLVLCRCLVKACGTKLATTTISLGNGQRVVEPKQAVEEFGSHMELVLTGHEPCPPLAETVLDVTGNDYRLIRLGSISETEIARLTQHRLLLSCDASSFAITEQPSLAQVVLVEGEPERVARRIKGMYEAQDNAESVVCLVHSGGVRRALEGVSGVHCFSEAGELPSEDDVSGWQLLTRKLLASINQMRSQDDIRYIMIEGVKRHQAAEDLMDRLTHLAHRVINNAPVGYQRDWGSDWPAE